MPKLCLNCMKRISLLAGRCPFCRDERQGVWGRLLLLIGFFLACWLVYRHEIKQWPFEAPAVEKVRRNSDAEGNRQEIPHTLQGL